jgi:peptide/nickel transport system permease protein
MSPYIIRRLTLVIPLLLGITIINYAIYALAPGDPVSAMINPMEAHEWSAEDMQKARARLGLDKPIPVRYALWLKEAVRGNLGYSVRTGLSVSETMVRGISNTFTLIALSMLLSSVGGVVLGILSALRPYSVLDYALTAFAFAGASMPGFFLALLLVYFVSLGLGILPTGGISTPGAPPSFLNRLEHMVLPVLALTYEGLGSLLRFTRAGMLEVLSQEYVTAARSKGLMERAVIGRHAFRNALLPLITVLGLRLPSLFGGALLIEFVFNYPGIGSIMVDATRQRDYPLVMGGVLVTAIAVLIANLIADISYGVADPRIRYE